MNMGFDGFTSRGETSVKMRKARAWGTRKVHSPCPYCKVECGNDADWVRHLAVKHRREAEVMFDEVRSVGTQ